MDAGDKNDQHRHQHLIVTNIDATYLTRIECLQHDCQYIQLPNYDHYRAMRELKSSKVN